MKNSIRIQFFSVNSIIEFARIMENESVNANVVGDDFHFSATSLLGLFNLGFFKPYILNFNDEEDKVEKVLQEIDVYIVE